MPASVLLKAIGLNTAINQLDVPPGSLVEASNVVIRNENILSQRRGLKIFGETFGTASDRTKQLISYRDRILRHFATTIEFETGDTTTSGVATFNAFSGSYTEQELGLRIKSVESNGNLYFTTSEGIKKISAKTADQLSSDSGFVTQAGGVKAVDLVATIKYTAGSQVGFLPQDSAVAYRVLWLIKDNNGNLIRGTPSQRAEVYNSLSSLTLQDFGLVLGALDNINQTGSIVTDGNYVSSLLLSSGASASELRSNLIALASKLDFDIKYADEVTPGSYPLDISTVSVTSNVVTITFSTGDPTQYLSSGSQVEVSGFTDSGAGSLDGTYTLTAVTATTISYNKIAPNGAGTVSGTAFVRSNEYRSIVQPGIPSTPPTNAELVAIQTYLESIITRLQSEPTGVISSTLSLTYIEPLDITTSATVLLKITIPDDVTADHFFQIYRSDIVEATGTTVLIDLVPNDEMKLVYEAYPTPAELAARLVEVEDVALDIFRTANLYTNEASGEGIAQANDVPPFAKDINRFKNIVFYANTKTRQRRLLSLLGIINMIQDFNNSPSLGAAESFATLAGSSVTNTGSSVLTGDLGVSPGSSVTGFPPGTFSGTLHSGDATAAQAQADLTSAYIALEAKPYDTDLTGQDLGGLTLTPGVYKFSSSAGLTGTLTLDAQGSSSAAWVFQIGSTLTTASSSVVTIINGGSAGNVFWQVGSSATLGTSTTFVGNIIALTSITLTTSATIDGRALARNGTVTLDTNIISVADINRIPPKIVITDGVTTNTYTFVTGSRESTRITTIAGAGLNASGTASYFYINSADDEREYVFWFKIGTAIDPMIPGKISVPVVADAGDTDAQIASKLAFTMATYINDFSVSISTNMVTVTNVSSGYTTDATAQTSGFTVLVLTQGIGANASLNQILLSDLISVGQAVDETARSFVRIINQNSNEIVNAFYLSTAGGVPGQILLEGRSLSDLQFYILGNNENTGLSFNPDISPENFIVSNTSANPTIVTTSSPHGMINGDKVVIVDSNSTPSIDGLYTITKLSNTTFSIPVNVTIAGDQGSIINATNGVFSDNEIKPNRIYYSKFQEPEAVPIVNFVDVGSEDREILRIFPLRDSLFVFKEDGLFRISGEINAFIVSLFDSSCILKAADSIALSNNRVYGWTTQGISETSEEGVNVISRNIDDIILRLGSSNFPSFRTSTWGLGYESDNSYIVYTVKQESDEAAKVGYRYDQVTQSWTSIDKDYTCGIIHSTDDKMYVGAGDTNAIEQERKQFNRLDFADREHPFTLEVNKYFNTILKFNTPVVEISDGDVLVQEQYLTSYQFNQTLKKLDNDPKSGDHDYFDLLEAVGGDNLRSKILAFAQKLDTDTGVTDIDYEDQISTKTGSITSISIANPTVITTSTPHELHTGRIVTLSGTDSDPLVNDTYTVTVLSPTTFSIPVNVDQTAGTTGSYATIDGDFRDIQVCYNVLIVKMNLDIDIVFHNYQESEGTTTQESIITDVNITTKTMIVNLTLPYIQGPLTVYKAIPTSIIYSPTIFDDPLTLKHIREATIMFANKAFTTATLSFASDLLPEFQDVIFNGSGNGIFGFESFGVGFFGGGSHGAPFRTYIPRDKARCRYMVVKFQHGIAREIFQIYGITLLGEIGQSSRAFR